MGTSLEFLADLLLLEEIEVVLVLPHDLPDALIPSQEITQELLLAVLGGEVLTPKR